MQHLSKFVTVLFLSHSSYLVHTHQLIKLSQKCTFRVNKHKHLKMQLTSSDLQGFSNGYLGPESVLVLLPSSDILDDSDLPLYNIHVHTLICAYA